MAVAGGYVMGYQMFLQGRQPIVVHQGLRRWDILKTADEAASLLESGLQAWVSAEVQTELLKRMAPQGALANVPPRQNVSPGTSGWGSPYLQLDDSPEAEGPPVYDSRTCAQRHDTEFQALKMEVELQGRRIARLETKLAQETRLREALQKKLSWWEADS